MTLLLQDPAIPDSEYLLERILEACEEATNGCGAFAFASAGGVRLLIQDAVFQSFLSRGSFNLVVGFESFTDVPALDALLSSQNAHPQLQISAFIGDEHDDHIFHPKVCWFEAASGGIFLVGSGNLTAGGLRGNCEAFTQQQLRPRELVSLQRNWSSWLQCHESHLLPLTDARVRACAQQNRRSRTRRTRSVLGEDEQGNIVVGRTTSDASSVLVAEIPRSGDRWNQANFSLRIFKDFFGATPGKTQRIVLVHVGEDGVEGPTEVRPSVAVSSHNYRFELDAASGVRYPQQGRPIAVFVRIGRRTFRYRLCMPGSASHREAGRILSQATGISASSVRRVATTAAGLRGLDTLRTIF